MGAGTGSNSALYKIVYPQRFPLSKSSVSLHIQICVVLSLFNPHALIAKEHSNMIEDGFEYYCLSGDIFAGGPSTWHVIDQDRRRVVPVTMDGEQDGDSLATEHFSRHSSQLSSDMYRIHVSHTGEIISTYTDSKDGPTYCVHYPFLHETFLPEGIQTVRRDELEELERLGPVADLVAYPPCLGESAKKVKPRCRSWIISSCDHANPWSGRLETLLLLAVCTKVLEGDEPVDASAPPPKYRSV